jgi:hypothetical protein
LAADQVTAENKEEIDADPPEAIEAARRLEAEERGVIDGNRDDGERAKKIETRLALSTRETRIDCYCRRFLLNNEKLAGSSFEKRTRCRP